MSLQEKVRQTIIMSGKSYAQIADALGVSAPAVYNWVNKGKYPSITRLGDFCKYFSISADWLFGLSKEGE